MGGAYDVVLFDLGGVLVRLGGVAQMGALSGIDDDAELWRRWLSSPWVRRFERGRCSPEEFAAGLVDEWGLPVPGGVFLERFRTWPEGLHDGAVELVREVAGRCRVACLSNINELHWELLATRWGLDDLFEPAFLSYRLDMVKPDRDIFAHAVAILGCPPGRVLFLDDNLLNVEPARAVGLAAEVVLGPDGARAALAGHGVLPTGRRGDPEHPVPGRAPASSDRGDPGAAMPHWPSHRG